MLREKHSLVWGRIPDAIQSVERVRCFRAGSQPAPERLWASRSPVLRPVREVLSLDWDRRARVTPVEQRKVFRPRSGGQYRTERPATSQEAWPGVAPEGLTPRRSEPLVERRQASAPRQGARRARSQAHGNMRFAGAEV